MAEQVSDAQRVEGVGNDAFQTGAFFNFVADGMCVNVARRRRAGGRALGSMMSDI